MSKYKTIQTQFTDRALLLAALKASGVPHEVDLTGNLVLYGYQGDARKERAMAVVRRQHIERAANDLGFAFDAGSRTYTAILSEYDSGAGRAGLRILQDIQREYATELAAREAESRGYTVTRLREGRVTRLRCVKA